MCYKSIYTFLIETFLFCCFLEAQNTNTPWSLLLLDDINLEENLTSEEDWEYLDELKKKYQHKININAVNRDELQRLSFLSEKQIENILAYVYQQPLISIYELMLIDGIGKKEIDYMAHFFYVEPIKVDNHWSFKNLFKYSKSELSSRFDYPLYKRVGYKEKYLGPSWYSTIRYKMKSLNKLECGFNLEKDSGEPFFALDNKYGYDYNSFYVALNDVGIIKKLLVGNYKLQFGEGLVMGSNSFMMHSLRSLLYPSLSGSIKNHSSNDEFNYFSGVATTLSLSKSFELSSFYSYRKLDGKVINKDVNKDMNSIVQTVYKTGLHQTKSDFLHRKKLKQQLVGLNLDFNYNNISLGITGYYCVNNYPYYPQKRNYNCYYPKGKTFYNIGIHYSYFWRNFRLRGELAKGKKGFASISTLLYHPRINVDILLLHRYYGYNYWGLFSKSYATSSRVQNENGWAILLLYTLNTNYSFSLSGDYYRCPWWKYRVSKPSKGFKGDIRMDAKYRLINYTIQYFYRNQERDVANTKGKIILPTYQHKVRNTISFSLHHWLLKTNLDYTLFQQKKIKNSHGYQITQSCSYTSTAFNFSLQGTFFNTSDYDSRVYSYEKNILYNYYIPCFTGMGYRLSTVLRFDLTTSLMLMAKYGMTHYFDREVIGSGLSAIESRTKMDLQCLIRLKF